MDDTLETRLAAIEQRLAALEHKRRHQREPATPESVLAWLRSQSDPSSIRTRDAMRRLHLKAAEFHAIRKTLLARGDITMRDDFIAYRPSRIAVQCVTAKL